MGEAREAKQNSNLLGSGGSQLPQAIQMMGKTLLSKHKMEKAQFFDWDREILTCIQKQNSITKSEVTSNH